VQGYSLVNVIADETGCDRLVLATRTAAKGRLFVLDSDYGPVYLAGGKKSDEESQASGAGPLRDLTSATHDFQMTKPDTTSRFMVLCPQGTTPLGGGMFNATPLGDDGAGLYSHSYERLGAQGGFHVTSTLIDPSRGAVASHRGVLQVLCAKGLVPTASPHATTYVHRHRTATVTAHCPDGTQVFSGGFQRTNFTTPGVSHGGVQYGGDYITESKAVGTNAWRVRGGATGINGGELTAIAYCTEDPSLPIQEISASAHIGEGDSASATTPHCPEGRTLIAGGFSFGGSHDALFANGYFTHSGTWAATGYGWFGSADLTAYGYCAEAQDTVDRSAFSAQPPADDDDKDRLIMYVGLGLITLFLLGFLRRRQVVWRRRRRAKRAARRPTP
jgi:hypothetical protein